jgi:hypothetical protein
MAAKKMRTSRAVANQSAGHLVLVMCQLPGPAQASLQQLTIPQHLSVWIPAKADPPLDMPPLCRQAFLFRLGYLIRV